MSKIINDLESLKFQATNERSHYYVKSTCEQAIEAFKAKDAKIAGLKKALMEHREYIQEMECRGDEDCDHCSMTWLLDEALKEFGGEK